VYFDGGSKSSLYCILRDRLKNVRTVSSLKVTCKTLGPGLALYTSSFNRKCKFTLVSKGPLRHRARSEEIGHIGLKPAL